MPTLAVISAFVIPLAVAGGILRAMRKEKPIPKLTKTCRSCSKPNSASKYRPDCYDCWMALSTPPPGKLYSDPDRLMYAVEELYETIARLTSAVNELTDHLDKQNPEQTQDSS